MARYIYIPNRVIDTNGISDGASLFFYLAGTTTPVGIYADEAQLVPLLNPYVVEAGAAVPEIFYDDNDQVRVRIVEEDGTVISDIAPYIEIASLGDLEATETVVFQARDQTFAARDATFAARDTTVAARDEAVDAAEDAGLSADAAAVNAGGLPYPNEAAGRAAVTDGQVFLAVGATDKRAIDVWRRDSSSGSTLLRSYPSLDAILRSRVIAYPNVFANRVVFADGEGGMGPTMLTPDSATIADLYNRIASAGGGVADLVRWVAEIMLVILYGQSLAIGTNPIGPLLSTTALRGGLRFSAGVRPTDSGSEDPTTWGGLDGLRETISPVATNLRETVASGFVQRINERFLRDYGVDLADKGQAVLCVATGEGGATWQQLSNPSTPWTRTINAIQHAIDETAAAGRSMQPSAILWMQGEANQNDTTSEYYNGVKALWDGLQAEAQAMTGNARPLIFCTYQTSSWPAVGWNDPLSADSYLQIAERNQYGLFASPVYPFPYVDTYHLTNAGYKSLGAYFGDAIYDFVIRQVKYAPLRPVVTRVSSNTLKLTYPVRVGAKLVFDASITTAAGVTLKQRGLRVAARADNLQENPPSEIDLTVSITGANEITIIGAADIPEGETFILRQGWSGNLQRVYTEIRDTGGDLVPVFDPTVLNLRMNNWLPTCSVLIP